MSGPVNGLLRHGNKSEMVKDVKNGEEMRYVIASYILYRDSRTGIQEQCSHSRRLQTPNAQYPNSQFHFMHRT
jgi:hypothetical protein